jgi:hypothetical protein
MIRAVRHTGVVARDLEKSAEFIAYWVLLKIVEL